MTDTALAKCHICSAVVPDKADDRRQHIDEHKHHAKQIDALARQLRALTADLAALRGHIDSTPADTGGIRITDMPADELDDDDITDPDTVADALAAFAPEPATAPALVPAAATLDDDEDDLPTHPTSPYGI